MTPLILGLIAASFVAQADVRPTLREADALSRAGDHAGALTVYERAAAAAGASGADRGTADMGVVASQLALGRYAEAARHAQEAARVFDSLGDLAGQAAATNYAGLAAMYAGEYGEARPAFAAAVKLSRASGNTEALVEQLTNLANVNYFLSRYAEAAHILDEARQIVEGAADRPWAGRRRRLVLANQAILQQRLGRYEPALRLYQQIDAAGGQLPPDEQAQLLSNQGVLYRRLGDPVKALAAYDRALSLFARHGHADGEIGVMKNRGIVLAIDLRRLPEAARSFSEALQRAGAVGNQRELMHAHLYRGETRLRQGRRDEALADFTAGLALARKLQTPEEEWKALFGLGRAAVNRSEADRFLEQAIARIEQIREEIRLPPLRSEFLNDKAEVYDALIRARLGIAPAADVFALIERRHSRGWRDMLGLTEAVTLDAVQRALPAGTLLLDYWHAPEGAAVVAITRTQADVFSLNIDREQIGAFLNGLAAGPSPGWRDRAHALAARLLPPSSWFDGISEVVIVPGGAVAMVPFDLLPAGDRPIVQRAAVTYVPSAATLLRAGPRPPAWRAPWRLQLEAFADPVFSSAALDDATSLRPRIAATVQEVRAIASELNGASRLHLGADNRKATLLTARDRPPLLHIATHAFADMNAAEQSRIIFSPDAEAGGAAGADYLFLREVYALDLAGVELAVLSACDTARGKAARVEGVQSFTRAFLAAGARSTVTTLWRVADEPTADFMALFYHHLQSGVSRAEALRRAKVRFLESGSGVADPHYWAAFALSGDGLRPVPRAVGWGSMALAAAAVVAVGGESLRRIRKSTTRPRARQQPGPDHSRAGG